MKIWKDFRKLRRIFTKELLPTSTRKEEPTMKYDLKDNEIWHIERFRKLLPEFQNALDEQADALWKLQTQIIKDAIQADQEEQK